MLRVRAASLALLAAALLAGCMAEQPPAADDAREGAGPAWEVVDIDGATMTRGAPPRNATLLFFMATWCSSCKATAPLIADVARERAPDGLAVLSLTVDPSETRADLVAWREERAQPWPHAVDEGLRVARTFGITQQSSVAVLDGEGNVVEKWGYGRVTGDALRAAVDRALGSA